MVRNVARWVWVLIPVVVVAGAVIVVVSDGPLSALFDVIWVAALAGLLLHLSISSRRKDRRNDENPPD